MGALIKSHFVRFDRCPSHEDSRASFAVYTDGHGYCFTCQYLCNDYVPPENLEPVAIRRIAPVAWSMVDAYQAQLDGAFRARRGWLWGRGLRHLTQDKLRFGHTGLYFTIPIWDGAGQLLTIRYRRDDRLCGEDRPKYKGLPGSKRTLYGLWQLHPEQHVVLCEGELDAALLMQEFWRRSIEGVTALSVTGGAGSLDVPTAQLLRPADFVTVAYDQDDAGQQGAQKALQLIHAEHGAGVIMHWPRHWGKDVTEVIRNVGFEDWWKCR